ncbi:MAG: hypothetical protein ABJA79_04545 [Parafilimonas sp.]
MQIVKTKTAEENPSLPDRNKGEKIIYKKNMGAFREKNDTTNKRLGAHQLFYLFTASIIQQNKMP